MPYLPTLEDVSPTLARAVLPTYLHHVMDASETLADFALRRLAKNEATRQELVEHIAAQREVCNTPLVAHSEGFDDGHGGTPSSPFSQHTPLSPGARAAKRAADDEKLSDLERALHAANVEASDIETRLRIAEIAAERLRGAPRELRAVSRLLVDVITDLEEYDSGEDEFKNDNTRHGGSVGSASSGRSTTSASPGKQEAIATAAAILADAERVDPSMPLVTGARVTEIARAAADAADALLTRAQQCLEEEAKFRALCSRAREARRVNADTTGYLGSSSRPVSATGSLLSSANSWKPPGQRNSSATPPSAASTSASSVSLFSPRASVSRASNASFVSTDSRLVWSPGGSGSQSVFARQSDATAKAQARRQVHRRSLKDARTQKRVQRNLEYHISRLEIATNEMSTEADSLESHLKRVETNHGVAAGKLDTLAWLLEHAEAYRTEAARREAERRRRRERRFHPSGVSVRKPNALGLPVTDASGSNPSSRPSSAASHRSTAIERWSERRAIRTNAVSRPSSSRPSTSQPTEKVEHWREKYARERESIISRESNRGSEFIGEAEVQLEFDEDTVGVPHEVDTIPEEVDTGLAEEISNGRLPPLPGKFDDIGGFGEDADVNGEDETSPHSTVFKSQPAQHGQNKRTSPLKRHHQKLIERKSIAPKETEVLSNDDDDDAVEAYPPVTVSAAPTPPVNRVLEMEDQEEVGVMSVDAFMGVSAVDAIAVDEEREPEEIPPQPESSLDAIEAELFELHRLEALENGKNVVDRNNEFETLAAFAIATVSSEPEEQVLTMDPSRVSTDSIVTMDSTVSKKPKKKPLPIPKIKPKPKPKPRQPWGPPPAPPKSKWKRNSLSRHALAELMKKVKKEGVDEIYESTTQQPEHTSGSAVVEGEEFSSSREMQSSSPKGKSQESPTSKHPQAETESHETRKELETREDQNEDKRVPGCGCVVM